MIKYIVELDDGDTIEIVAEFLSVIEGYHLFFKSGKRHEFIENRYIKNITENPIIPAQSVTPILIIPDQE
jgi:hypothetical protein